MTPQQQLRALLDKHCSTLKTQMSAFEDSYRDGAHATPAPEPAMRILHSFKGNSGTMGFMTVHEQVAALEERLKAPETPDAAEIDRRIASLKQLVADLRAEQSRHYDLAI